ncbi:hypothetical protein FB550_111122 [Neobacillus bataviensis]|uniref:Nucleotide-diphospho-sugar transferase n=1 Tax=Neobacillus bataviensis TaxID=220685 RepID=A0A561CZJ4_9BACI|nr:hypothetical protein [Neobacillus bataviensis]TWD96464.1 hypothetical protein FB550_111122 [Neobacillus bataviensis]
MIICTVTTTRFLPEAIVMAKSAKTHIPNSTVVVCLVEQSIHPAASSCQYFDRVILAKDLGIKNFYKHLFKYEGLEAVTSVKGKLLLHLFDIFPKEEKFIFLDTDIKIFGPLDEVIHALDQSPVLVTPHITEDDGIIDNELTTIIYGICNTAFLAVKRSDEAENFLRWWAYRLKKYCYENTSEGMYVDQKWVDLALSIFDVHLFKHPGYNVACWNLPQRRLKYNSKGNYSVNKQPLRCFHFSGLFNNRLNSVLKQYLPDKTHAVYQIKDTYLQELQQAGQDKLSNEPWSYDYFVNGEKIKSKSRKKYSGSSKLQNKFSNPFEQSNATFLGK